MLTVPEVTPASSRLVPVRVTQPMFASSSLLTLTRTWLRLRRQLRRPVVVAVQRALRLLLLPRLPQLKRQRLKLLLKKQQRLNNKVTKYISIATLHPFYRMERFFVSCACYTVVANINSSDVCLTWNFCVFLHKSFNSVNSYVCNRTQPNLETLLQISQILNVNMKDLIADQEQKQ